jgi:penicillin-binding protein
MGLQDGKINTSFVFNEPINKNLWLPNIEGWVYPAIKRMKETPGALNLRNAITYSDNIFFAYTALKVGSDSFLQHCADFGFNQPMPFDLPLKTSNSGQMGTMRYLADSGYGQGELLITPLQMATLFGSLANGGDIMVPRLVQSICHTEGPRYLTDKTNPPEVWKQGALPKSTLDILVPYLKRVAQIGTARELNTPELRKYGICAKTGTAEIGADKSREIAWIIGFTTEGRDGNNRLVCVTLEVPAKEGGVRTKIAEAMFLPTEAEKAAEEEKEQEDRGN